MIGYMISAMAGYDNCPDMSVLAPAMPWTPGYGAPKYNQRKTRKRKRIAGKR